MRLSVNEVSALPALEIVGEERTVHRVCAVVMISYARSTGSLWRRSAIPWSVTRISTECSLWSGCGTIGTILLIAPPLVIDGQLNIDM